MVSFPYGNELPFPGDQYHFPDVRIGSTSDLQPVGQLAGAASQVVRRVWQTGLARAGQQVAICSVYTPAARS